MLEYSRPFKKESGPYKEKITSKEMSFSLKIDRTLGHTYRARGEYGMGGHAPPPVPPPIPSPDDDLQTASMKATG